MSREFIEPLLTRDQVAKKFNLEKRWLELAAHKGEGPPMVKISRRMVRYRASDVNRWIDGLIVPNGDAASK